MVRRSFPSGWASRFVLALTVTLVGWGVCFPVRADSGALSSNVYKDPKGYFKIRPPASWTVREYGSDPRGKVGFDYSSGTRKIQLKIIGMASNFPNFEALLSDCERTAERLRSRYRAKIVCSKGSLFGLPAVEAHVKLPNGFTQKQFQVLMGKNHYTFALGGHPDLFKRYLPLAKQSIGTFEPMFPVATPGDEKRHALASKIRLANLYLRIGKPQWALVAVEEGLKLDSGNQELLELHAQLLNSSGGKR